jgi:hypothetical protein
LATGTRAWWSGTTAISHPRMKQTPSEPRPHALPVPVDDARIEAERWAPRTKPAWTSWRSAATLKFLVVLALSRLKHRFESRRERQSDQWLRPGHGGGNRKSGDTPGTHSHGATRHQARAYERFVTLTLFLPPLVTADLDYPASLGAPYLRRGFNAGLTFPRMASRGGMQQVRQITALQPEGRKRKRPSRFV